MSAEKLNRFLKALDVVKQDYTCGFCSELCEKPVTLSTCYHIICADHFKSLSNCPTCDKPLVGCKIFKDERLEACVSSARELDVMFQTLRSKNVSIETKNVSIEALNVSIEPRNENSSGTNKRKTKLGTAFNTSSHDKENTISASKKSNIHNSITTSNQTKKGNYKANDNLNTTLTSISSFKVNKGIEKRNTKGETALHLACRLGKIDKVVDLLKQGANTNTKDNAGWTPLHEVVQNGRLDLVKLLLQYNTLIDVPGQSNETPLHEAVRYGHKSIAEELVKNGADLYARNCKGEIPLELASKDMKNVLEESSEEIYQTQGVNITYLTKLYIELDYDDIRVYCVSQFRTVLNKVKLLTKHHSNLHLEVKFTKKVTHLIVDTEDDLICTSSLDVLQGIVSAVWVLSSEWIIKSTEKKLEPFQDYEVKGVGTTSYNGPKNSRYNKYKQLPGIFDGCHFYLHNFHTKYEISKSMVLTKAVLSKLITDAGGVVLRRVPNPELIPEPEKLVPYHAKKGSKLINCSHYIIFKDTYEPMYNMSHIKALPLGWLIECIERYELCEPWQN